MVSTSHYYQSPQTTPPMNSCGRAAGKNTILRQLLRSTETSPDSTTTINASPKQPTPVAMPQPSAHAHQQPSPGGRPPSVLLKLLEHPPQHQPTLPTSIANSPLDKLAMENKDKTDQPTVATRLAEYLLTKQKTNTTVPTGDVDRLVFTF